MNDYFRIEMSLFYETKDGNAKVERRATDFFPKNYLKSYRMSESSIKKITKPTWSIKRGIGTI